MKGKFIKTMLDDAGLPLEMQPLSFVCPVCGRILKFCHYDKKITTEGELVYDIELQCPAYPRDSRQQINEELKGNYGDHSHYRWYRGIWVKHEFCIGDVIQKKEEWRIK